jgi:hypothetical protein
MCVEKIKQIPLQPKCRSKASEDQESRDAGERQERGGRLRSQHADTPRCLHAPLSSWLIADRRQRLHRIVSQTDRPVKSFVSLRSADSLFVRPSESETSTNTHICLFIGHRDLTWNGTSHAEMKEAAHKHLCVLEAMMKTELTYLPNVSFSSVAITSNSNFEISPNETIPNRKPP